jgi:hypothetical protein
MPRFPSLDWCEALVRELERDTTILPALKEWGGRSVGVVIGKDGGLARDFCIFAKPDKALPKLLELRLCEDEDDLELEEPDYLFRAPLGTVKQLILKQLDPLEVLRKGQVRVEGDLKFLLTFSQKYQRVGEAAMAQVLTTW